MRWLSTLLLGVALVLPNLALGAAALQEDTYTPIVQTDDYRSWQAYRCDPNQALGPDIDTPAGGSECEAGDWSKRMDCTGMSKISVFYEMYNTATGSGTVKVWNCWGVVGTPGFVGGVTFATLEPPGDTEAPATTPSDPNDPDPFCVDLTASAGVTLNGIAAGTQAMWLDGTLLNWIIVEQDVCTDCAGTVMVSCGR